MLKSNEYFDGKVKSIALETAKGPATVGVMEKGEYEFGTSTKEEMVVTTGSLKVKLPGESDYTTYDAGTTFFVEKDVKFTVIADADTSYICYYS